MEREDKPAILPVLAEADNGLAGEVLAFSDVSPVFRLFVGLVLLIVLLRVYDMKPRK